MPTITKEISASERDGYQNGTTVVNSSSTVFIRWDGIQDVLFIFDDLSELQGATVTSAKLRLHATGIKLGAKLRVQNSASAPDIIATPGDITGRSYGSVVSWPVTSISSNSYNESPNISALVQAVIDAYPTTVDRIAIYLDEDSDEETNVTVKMFDNGSNVPQLSLTYTGGSGGESKKKQAELKPKRVKRIERPSGFISKGIIT